MKPVLGPLRNPIRDYAWGSREVLARLQGRPVPSATTEAELWLGAHPSAPSTWLPAAEEHPLDGAIAADPDHMLGRAVVERFGARLPFMLKILAVAHPLSLQVHPNAEQAREGFAREEASGVALTAADRNYTDPWPKPELIRALTPFDALCGFRAVDASLDLLDRLAVAELDWLTDAFRARGRAATIEAVARVLTSPPERHGPLVRAVGKAGSELAASTDRWAPEGAWIQELAERYPDDPGVVVALLLELVRLEPGESLHVPAGTLHSYLAGTCVEIMASSDSVLRGGLTSKHVDVAELLSVVAHGADRCLPVAPREVGAERVHPTPAPHFRLAELAPDGEAVALDERGGQILLALGGAVTLAAGAVRVRLGAGESAFVAAAAGTITVSGDATVFRATVGDPEPG